MKHADPCDHCDADDVTCCDHCGGGAASPDRYVVRVLDEIDE